VAQGLCQMTSSQAPTSGTNAVRDRTRQEQPYRDRRVDENLDLFRRMKAGRVFPNGARRVARQKRHGVRATSICAMQ